MQHSESLISIMHKRDEMNFILKSDMYIKNAFLK
jgi:hypothetical protein